MPTKEFKKQMIRFMLGDACKMVNFFIMIIICLVPLTINPTAIDYYYLPKVLSIYVLCIFMLLFYFVKLRKKIISTYAPDFLLVGYIFLITLSTFFSIDRAMSLIGRPFRWEGFAVIFCYIFIYFIASKYYIFFNKHLKYFIIFSTLIAAYGTIQYYGYEVIKPDFFRINWIGHSYSTIGNRNFLGSYLVLALPVSMYYYIYSKRIGYLISSCILYSCLLCTLARGAWIGFSVLLLFFIFYIFKYKIYIKYLLVMLGAFVIVTYIINITSGGNLLNRASSLKSDIKNITSDYGGSNRIFIWKNSLKLIPTNPILGSGPDTLGIAFMEHFGDEAKQIFKSTDIVIDKAHNEYLQQAVTTGIPSMVLYILFGLTILIKAHKNIENNKLLIPLFCCILGYAVQAFFNISVVSVAPVMWALLGITSNLAYDEKTNVRHESHEDVSSSTYITLRM
jgi:O-antigen ligase